MRSPLASIGEHLSLDVGEDAIYWARSRPGRAGLCLLEWGTVEVDPDIGADAYLERIAQIPWTRAARIEVPIRSPDLRHQRVSLPALTPAQAYKIGRRRATEFLAAQRDASVGSFMRVRRRGAHPLWLVAAPASVPALFEQRFVALGLHIHRLSSEALALGNLARLLPPNAPDTVTAIFDIHREGGDCVICDDQGWLFNRVIPIRFAPGQTARSLGATSRIANDADEKREGFAPAAIERIGTELSRTFQYVERELHVPRVARVVLAGEGHDLLSLPPALGRMLGVPVSLIGDLIASGPARGMPPEAARVIGLALAPDPRGCSLLPPESKERRRTHRARLHLLAALGVAVLACGAATLRLGWRALSARSDIAEMRESMDGDARRREVIAQAGDQRRRARAQMESLGTWLRAEPPWGSLLRAVGALAPPDVAVEELLVQRVDERFETILVVEVRGATVASAATAMAAYAAELRRAPFLSVGDGERDATRQMLQDDRGVRVYFRLPLRVAPLVQHPTLAGRDASAAAVHESSAVRGRGIHRRASDEERDADA
jgi:hypothetical protein